MTKKTITLKGEIVERLEAYARQQGLSIEEALSNVLPPESPVIASEFGQALVEAMADIEWLIDAPDLSMNSRQNYQEGRHPHEPKS